LLRRLRHDYGNHLQVIGGYLELGQPERAKEYLRTVMEEIGSESIVFNSFRGDAALYFYEQLSMARDLGIILRFEDLDLDSWEILKAKHEPYQSILALIKETPKLEDDTPIYLSLYEDEVGVDMFFSCSGWVQSPKRVKVKKE
jgi:hypothetical protein